MMEIRVRRNGVGFVVELVHVKLHSENILEVRECDYRDLPDCVAELMTITANLTKV